MTWRGRRMPAEPGAPSKVVTWWARLWLVPIVTLLVTGPSCHAARAASAILATRQVAGVIESIVRQRLAEHEHVLRGIAGLFDTRDRVTSAEWDRYLNAIRPEKSTVGLHAIGFSARVSDTTLQSLEAEMQAERHPFFVWPIGSREAFHPIVFVYPTTRSNLAALGYDMFTDPVRADAMVQARDEGAVALSRVTTLVRDDTPSNAPGMVMYLPVYAPGMPARTVAERRAALRGFVYGAYRAGDLIASAIGEHAGGIDFEIYDGLRPTAQGLLYRSAPGRPLADSGDNAMATQAVSFEIAGHPWLLVTAPSASSPTAAGRSHYWLIAAGGAALIGLGLYAGAFAAIARRRRHVGAEETARAAGGAPQVAAENASGTPERAADVGRISYKGPERRRPSHSVELTRALERALRAEESNRVLEAQLSAMRAQHVESMKLTQLAQKAQQTALEGQRALATRVEELRTAVDAAEAASRTKSSFLAAMSHEIRTPMSGILGMTDLLIDTPLSPDQREQIAMIQRSGRALLLIINDILDFSKVEAGKLEVESIRVDLRPAVDDVIQLLRPRATERNLDLSVDYGEGLPETIQTDPGRVRQVLTNLIGNAIKFTELGQVRVDVEFAPDAGQLRFRVVDTGPGIPVESQRSLFQPFNQLNVSTTRRFGGTGLGLAISRQLVSLLGGEIGVISPAREHPSAGGPGSVFWFTVPATAPAGVIAGSPAAVAAAWTPAPVAPSVAPTPPSCRVLVAEDNVVNQTVIRAMLRKLGVDPTIVADGAQAVSAMAESSYDVVLMDCQMPVMDGFEATRVIRTQHGAGPTIVAVTANAMAGDEEDCRAAGMDDYISKPVTAGELRRVLAAWLTTGATGTDAKTTDSSRAA